MVESYDKVEFDNVVYCSMCLSNLPPNPSYVTRLFSYREEKRGSARRRKKADKAALEIFSHRTRPVLR